MYPGSRGQQIEGQSRGVCVGVCRGGGSVKTNHDTTLFP